MNNMAFISTVLLACLSISSVCDLTNGNMLDLSYAYSNKTLASPVMFPFHLEVMTAGFKQLKDGRNIWVEYNKFTMPEHLGTHMDAPSHVSYDNFSSWTVDEIPLEHLRGPGVVIDISERAKLDPDTVVTVKDLMEWEDKYGRIKDGSIVLMYSGWEEKWKQGITAYLGNEKSASEYHFPGFGVEAAAWLVTHRNIYGVGVDTLSIDNGVNTKNKDAHLVFFAKNIYGLENMHNLAKVPEAGSLLYVFPMKILGGSGGPTRVFAEYWDDHIHPTPVSVGTSIHVTMTISLVIITVLKTIFQMH